eukprot:gene3187-3640_t
MSVNKEVKRITTHILQEMKNRGEKIAMLTAYDYSMATILGDAGLDVLLVGDSASNVMAGHETTLPITLDQMIYHAQSVVRGAGRALVVVDLPFGTYQGNSKEALNSAIRIMKESGAHGVKMEGGEEIAESIQRIVTAGIPVMGHLGLTPQSIYKFGTYTVRAKDELEAEKLKSDAIILEQSGCFSVVLEKIPAKLGKEVSQSLHIPTIGIGAGPDCDGQVLVVNDMIGLTKGFKPRFLRQYLDLYTGIKDAAEAYIKDDNHLIAINKRAGDIVQVDETGDEPLEEKVKKYLVATYNKPNTAFLGVVHRLDRPVSGVILFAKTSKALERMNAQFKNREVKKTYWAIVRKKPALHSGTLVHWLVKNPQKNVVTPYEKEVPGSQRAELSYRLIGELGGYYLIEVDPLTGRSHQIRGEQEREHLSARTPPAVQSSCKKGTRKHFCQIAG